MATPRAPEYDTSAVTRPVAAPVDTFVRAAQPIQDVSGLGAIAQSLDAFGVRLGRFAEDATRLRDERDTDDARRKAELSKVRSWTEAVERGEVDAGASPVFQRAWKETRGAALASEYGSALLQGLSAPDNPIRNSDDPAAINAWIEERRRQFAEALDPDTQRGFLARAGQFEVSAAQHANAERIKRIEAEAETSLGQAMVAAINNGLAQGMSPAQAIAAAQEEGAALRFAGLRGDKMNAILAQSIMAVAEDKQRPDLLRAANEPRPDLERPGKTVAGVGQIPAFRQHFAQAAMRIESRAFQQEQRRIMLEERAEKRRATQEAGAMLSDLVERVSKGEAMPALDMARLRAISRVDPEFSVRYMQTRERLQNLGEQQDLPTLGRLRAELFAASDPQGALNEMLQTGRLTDQRFLSELAMAASRATEGRSFVMSMDSVRSLYSGISRNYQAEFSFERPSLIRAVNIAEMYFNSEITRWATEYQQAHGGKMPSAQEALEKAIQLRQQTDSFVNAWGRDERVMNPDLWRPGQSLPESPQVAPQPASTRAPASPTAPSRSPTRPAPRAPATTPAVAPAVAPTDSPVAPAADPVEAYLASLGPGFTFIPPPDKRPSPADIEALERGAMTPNAARVIEMFDRIYGRGAAAFYTGNLRN